MLEERVQRGGFRGRWLMVTPTYRDDVKWDRRHMTAYMHRMRQWFRRQRVPLHYTWVMELTKRGRPHYHLLVWVPRHLLLPSADKRGWWPHGMTRTEKARNAVGYLAKYASKLGDAHNVGDVEEDGSVSWRSFPRHARICGGTMFKGEQGREWRYWTAPQWARDSVPKGTPLKRVSGGYVVLDTGELLLSPWRFVGLSADRKQLLFVQRAPPVEARAV